MASETNERIAARVRRLDSMGYMENLRKHHALVDEEKYIKLGDAILYWNKNNKDYLAGSLYLQPNGKFLIASDEFEICYQMDQLRMIENELEETWLKLFVRGWYFKKEDGIYVGRLIG